MESPGETIYRRKRRRLNDQDYPEDKQTQVAAASPGELGSMRKDVAKGSSSFVGSGSGIYFVRTVQAAFARDRERQQQNQTISEDLVPGEDDRLTRVASASLWTAEEIDRDVSTEQNIAFDELVVWSQAYFDNWHPPFPFLIGSHVLDLFEKISRGGMKSLSDSDSVIVRSILSISLADKRQMPHQTSTPLPPNLVFATLDDAVTSLTPLLVKPSSMHGLQALVAVQMFLISMLHLNAASRIGGLIVRMVFHLGLHRCPTKYEQFSSADIDIRKRLFWAIYVVERYLSQSLGLPLDLKDDDIDVCYCDQEVHNRPNRDATMEHEQVPDSRLLLLPSLLARHGKIRGMTLDLRHITAKNRMADPDDVAEIEAEAARWWNQAQDLLEPDFNERPENTVKSGAKFSLQPSHKLLLEVQKHESIILLNRPVISLGKSNSLYSAAMQKCIGAAKQIVSKVFQHMQSATRGDTQQKGRHESPLCWPGFTWCVWMSGLILVYAASEGHYSPTSAEREAERCVRILDTLSLRGSPWPGACATALRDLRKAPSSENVNTDQNANLAGSKHSGGGNTDVHTANPTTHTTNITTGSPNRHNEAHALSSVPSTSFPIIEAGTHTTNSQTTNTNSTAQNHSSEPLQIGLPYSHPAGDQGIWQSFDSSSGPFPADSEETYGFNDIFQLMDVSWQMSEPMYDSGFNDFLRF